MTVSFLQVFISLMAGMALIIFLTAVWRVHAFFALLLACFVVGLGVELPFATILSTIKQGFGSIMQSLALIIILGTTLGILLEHTGSTKVMANYILKKVGDKHAAWAMSITGFIVGLPVFCDSGYIVLSGLNRHLSKRTGIPVTIMSVSLATGLYAVHCLVPPHPGAAAAAGTIGVDFGKLLLAGIFIAIPGMLVGHAWAKYAGKKHPDPIIETEVAIINSKQPSIVKAFLPILIPILLITAKSFISVDKAMANGWLNIFSILGDPSIALATGIVLAIIFNPGWNKNSMGHLLQESAEKAGGILVIIGAGGAFGAVLAATNIGAHFSQLKALGSMGILFPFLLSFVLKTAQGSSTVAIITAAAIVQPLLPALGLTSDSGKLLCVLSMGAGSMMISHANDAYFWVIAKFSGLDMKAMLRVYSVATLFMGLVSLLMVYFLSLFLS